MKEYRYTVPSNKRTPNDDPGDFQIEAPLIILLLIWNLLNLFPPVLIQETKCYQTSLFLAILTP